MILRCGGCWNISAHFNINQLLCIQSSWSSADRRTQRISWRWVWCIQIGKHKKVKEFGGMQVRRKCSAMNTTHRPRSTGWWLLRKHHIPFFTYHSTSIFLTHSTSPFLYHNKLFSLCVPNQLLRFCCPIKLGNFVIPFNWSFLVAPFNWAIFC